MKIEASDKEIQNIFSLGYFQIPRFQRPYSWEKDEIQSFWDDVVSDTTNNYFIGSMVVYQSVKPYFGIVDGQQRLTTITIMLAVIRDAFLKINEINLAKGIHKFIESPNTDYENEFILKTETSFPYLQSHIQEFRDGLADLPINCEVGSEEINLKSAYELLSENLTKYIPNLIDCDQLSLLEPSPIVSHLKELRDKILALKLVFIQLDNEEDAYLIFETLNARGKDLKTSDLVKNLILKTIKTSNVTLDNPKEKWNNIIKRFDDITDQQNLIDSFLVHYWLSKHEFTTEKQLFSKIKIYVGNNTAAAKLLNDLDTFSITYCKMLKPRAINWPKEQQAIKIALINLNIFKVKQQIPFIIALLKCYELKQITIKQCITMINKIEHFHFIFNAITQQRSSGSITTMYSQFAIQLINAPDSNKANNVLTDISKKLQEKIPSYEEFSIKFNELNYLSSKTKSKAIVKYSLNKLMGDEINGLNIDHDHLTIEHLLPEANLKNGSPPELIGNIGNLLLIDDKTNGSRLNDKNASEKINILKSKSYPLEDNFIFDTTWDKETIATRNEKISNYLYNRIKF